MEAIRVLLIDDDEEDFMIVKDILGEIPNRKYLLHWCSQYQEALASCRANAHDVYLIDYRLGPDSGLELIKEGIAQGCQAPLILLTGQGDDEIDEMALQAGASEYLVKVDLDAYKLERAIRYSLAHARDMKEIRSLNTELEKRVEERTSQLAHLVEELENEVKERRQAEIALRQSQELYTAISRYFPNGVIGVLNHDLCYEFVEGSELKTMGHSTASLLHQHAFEVGPLVQCTPDFKEAIRTVSTDVDVAFEFPLNGNFYSGNAVGLPGSPRLILLVIQNITRTKKAEQKIRQSLEKERELNELKSRFVSMASHEFRTPLGTILSSVTLIGKYNLPDDEPRRIKHIQRIKSNVQNLTQILNDFLSISKLEEGKEVVNGSEFELIGFLDDLLEEMQPSVKQGQVIIHEHLGDTRRVFLDKQILKNILLNLLSNAIKYSPEGSQIQLITEFRQREIIISVSDKGIGIPEVDQTHLFERFFRAQNATNIQGTGLGLHIVKKYLDLLGGQISFTSQYGNGTTFIVSMPQRLEHVSQQ